MYRAAGNDTPGSRGIGDWEVSPDEFSVAETLVCELDGATRLKNGAALALAIPAARAYLFDADGKAFRRHVAEAQQEAA